MFKCRSLQLLISVFLLTSLVLLGISNVGASSSSPATWVELYGGALDDKAAAIVQTGDGGCAIAGTTYSFGTGGGDFWLLKIDSSGNMQWNQTYGGPESDVAVAMVQTSDGGYAVSGWTSSLKGFAGLSSYMFLIKVDVNGNIQWNSTYEGLGDNIDLFAVQTDDGGYAMAGTTKSTDEGAHYDIWFAKVDASGVYIPEFLSWTPMLVVLAVLAVALVFYKLRLPKSDKW